MHLFVVCLGRATGAYRCKNLQKHARTSGAQGWLLHRAPFSDFSIDTLPPLTLVDLVCLSHVRRRGHAGSEQNFVLALFASESDLPEF
jgi:hypothetical protein